MIKETKQNNKYKQRNKNEIKKKTTESFTNTIINSI